MSEIEEKLQAEIEAEELAFREKEEKEKSRGEGQGAVVWLVVWNMNFIFPYIGFLIIPIDFHIFQRGGPTTNQLLLNVVERLWSQEVFFG